MDLIKLLDVIQVQRHDFLNHLQVISGLSQLNKPERLREYIIQISAEMAQMSKTTRLRIPELTAALLAGFNLAARYQVRLDLTVDSDYQNLALPGRVAAEALEKLLGCAMEALADPAVPDQELFTCCLELIFLENEAHYLCRLVMPGQLPDKKALELCPKLTDGLLLPYGGRVSLTEADNGAEINMFLPRKKE